MMVYKLLSILLRYPDDVVLIHREEVAGAVHELPDSAEKQAMEDFLEHWLGADAHRLQAEYTATFDFRGRGNLYLSYYTYGDQRLRGQALAEIKQVYEAAGYELESTELPDHLPLVLEFAAAEPEAGGRLLAGFRGAIELIHRSLGRDESPYAPLVEALAGMLPELDEEEIGNLRQLIAQGPPQETVGLEPYGAQTPPGGALGGVG
jgi:nitrate reductase delta subunit